MIDRFKMQTLLEYFLCLLLVVDIESAIAPPPWANPIHNPCASQPHGWQLLYWPDDGKCYKIFQIGSPCPETMELGPSGTSGGVVAECRCPPGTAQSPRDALCHRIFTKASCPRGQYFSPVPDMPSSSGSKRRWGVCRELESCSERRQIFWPRTEKCYDKFTRGPCPLGKLITLDSDNFPTCSCSINSELGAYYWHGGPTGCYEHYTKGPCSESGEIFLPDGTCGCRQHLPHYYPPTGKCYPLGGIGPCRQGHYFIVTGEEIHGKCICKPNHVLYKDNVCYRIHTRGPCDIGEMLMNSTTCVQVPCKRGRLYFPREKTCYKIGLRGPCPNGQIVLYDRNVRPSIDGVSYNGVCGCTNALEMAGKCTDVINLSCEDIPGMFIVNNKCYKLYTQGPCSQGEWLTAQRQSRNGNNDSNNNNSNNYDDDDSMLWRDNNKSQRAKVRCECRPDYKRIFKHSNNKTNIEIYGIAELNECQPPSVTLAKFLNENTNAVNY